MNYDKDAVFMVYDLEGVPLGEVREEDGHLVWPKGVNGWKHALDCTIEPYAEQSLEENLEFATRVHKHAVVRRV